MKLKELIITVPVIKKMTFLKWIFSEYQTL